MGGRAYVPTLNPHVVVKSRNLPPLRSTLHSYRFHFTGDAPTDPHANVIVVGNHSAGLDFMSGVVVSHRFGVNCGRFMTFMKQSLQFVPTIGWTMWCQGSLFLKRSWEKDEKRINAKLDSMKTCVDALVFLSHTERTDTESRNSSTLTVAEMLI